VKTLAATILAVLIALATLTPAAANSKGPHATTGAPAAQKPQSTRYFTYSDSISAISWASAHWGVNYYWLLRVARCESGLNPYAYNPYGPSGLFQFLPGTYWLYAARIGETRSYWNPYASANVAAFMFHAGLSYQWGCR
jgi:soluble lytic murein transglycosylase-like protein